MNYFDVYKNKDKAEQPNDLPVNEKTIADAMQTLINYKNSKANLEKRIVENDKWYRQQHYDYINSNDQKPTTAWLFNSIANKHADAMDNFPDVTILPREESDKAISETLSDIIPVVLENNKFKKTYDKGWMRKLKAGTAVYQVIYDKNADKFGRGDIAIRNIDILNIFFEPDCEYIQNSKNVFHVELFDFETLQNMYPDMQLTATGNELSLMKYQTTNNIEIQNKTAVIDWYYKKDNKLHLCKFACGKVLFASENEPDLYPNGFYEHGKYPFVFDPLFADEQSPAGFGYIDVMRPCQLYIDRLNAVILDNAAMAAKKRFFIKDHAGVNEDEFRDWSNDLIHCTSAQLGADAIREIDINPLPPVTISVLDRKIEEMKETSGNRDFSQGGTTSGVTAASAIAALQEAGSKLSRDMIQASYTAFAEIVELVIELIRQFYDDQRCFRIVGNDGVMKFVKFNNAQMRSHTEMLFGNELSTREPVFDVSVKAHKASPFTRISQNELAKELGGMGVFNPETVHMTLPMLDMMDFDGKDALVAKLSEMGSQYNAFMKFQQLAPEIQQRIMQLVEMVNQQMTPQPPQTQYNQQPLNYVPSSSSESPADKARERVLNSATPKV